MDPISPSVNDDTSLLSAVIAGATAGVVQTVVTYPFEYIKTTSQIENITLMKKAHDIPMNSIKPLFIGCNALAVGNALKASTRFLIFNNFSSFMADNGHTTAPKVVVAGLMTGFLETFWVIPFENIKTRMIENSMKVQGFQTILPKYATTIQQQQQQQSSKLKTSKRPSTSSVPALASTSSVGISPRQKHIDFYNKNPSTTFFRMVKEIYLTKGLSGFKQGSLITVFRQCMNSMVWFSTYNSLQQFIDPNRDSISELELLGMGLASSVAVVATTQPIDVLKTRMQTKDYKLLYRDIMTCVVKIFLEEGVKKLWSGWMPRLVKVSCSSSVTLMTYEFVQKRVNQMVNIRPFAAE